MVEEKKPCPECGNKLNYSRADEIYLCPYCGGEFVERGGEILKKGAKTKPKKGDLTAEEMRAELEGAFEDSLIGSDLATERARKARRQDESHLLDLRMRKTEALRMIRVANRTGISLCLFLDFVFIALAYNYDVLIYGLVLAAVLTAGTYFYLSSYATKIRQWETRVEAETKELEKDLYLKELEKELDEEEEPIE